MTLYKKTKAPKAALRTKMPGCHSFDAYCVRHCKYTNFFNYQQKTHENSTSNHKCRFYPNISNSKPWKTLLTSINSKQRAPCNLARRSLFYMPPIASITSIVPIDSK